MSGINPLVAAANPLLNVTAQLRATAQHPDPAALREALAQGIKEFEARAKAAGIAPERVVAARYALCTLLDEIAASTPWGSSGVWARQSLLVMFHNEGWGGEKFFQLLGKLAENPAANRDLLELLYVCLALGLEGRYRVLDNGRAQLEQLRERLAQLLRQNRGEYERELSPHWRGTVAPRHAVLTILPMWVVVVVCGAILLGAYLTFSFRLNNISDPVFARIQSIRVAPPAPRPATRFVAPAPHATAPQPRLANLLAPEIAQDLVAVRDAADRSVVTLRGDGLFAPGSATPSAAFLPLLARIAEALNAIPGPIQVTGHTDSQPIRSVRFPSNWHLSQARAEAVSKLLAVQVAPQRLSAEGRADAEPVASNDSADGTRTQPARRNHPLCNGFPMKGLFRLLFHPWLVGALGLAALGLIIWYVGPLIGLADYRPLESSLARALLIAAIVGFYVGKAIWQFVKRQRANARLMNGLVKPPAASSPGPGQQEVETLRGRFEEAVEVLKETRGRQTGWGRFAGLGRRQYLYELPWYIFIGAPGSGKTTALVNSGLQFPLAQHFGQEAIRGVGGTRNCDWWFTDQAILLDTAGRYTTQESNREVDSAAWNGFLQLLKRFRPRRPINGVILTVSVADLLQQTAVQTEILVNSLRQRIQELYTELNIRFPLYVLVTKADLLAGFVEFFGELGREERAQVWGVTFPAAEPGTEVLADFTNEYAALETRLYDRLVDRLQQERDPQRRAALYVFPQQFSALREPLTTILQKVLGASRYQVAPMVRGIYFTSGTQEGSPIDRVLGGLARALRLDNRLVLPPQGSGKSFFLTRLVQDVIFPEAGLAGTNLRWERRRALLEWTGIAAAAVLTLGSITAWSVSYLRNQAFVAGVDHKLQAVTEDVRNVQAYANADLVGLLPVLQSVSTMAAPSGETTAGASPVTMGFGLYQGDKLAAAADYAYRHLLQDAFLPRLGLRLEEQLSSEARNNPELLYETLKAYLMLSDPAHFDPVALKAFITADWQANLPREVSPQQRQALEHHLDALLNRGWISAPIVPDTGLIERARADLARTPLAQRIYNRLKRQGLGEDLPEFTIAKAAGPSAALVFKRASGKPLTQGVPGLFSYTGYHQAFVQSSRQVTRQLAQEQGWVLGLAPQDYPLSGGMQSDLLDQVRRLYLEDYARTWESFVDDIMLIPAANLELSIQEAGILSAPNSPLPALLRAIVNEVTLARADEAEKTLVGKATDRVQSARANLMKLFGQSDAQVSTGSAESLPAQIVDARFENLRRMVQGSAPGQPAPIDATLALVNELYTLLLATETAVKGGMSPPTSDVPTRLKAEALRLPDPLRSMLTTLSQDSARQALGATRANLSQAIGTDIGEFCNRAISGRYPFVKSSARDVTREDFAKLFAPGGLLDDFFKQNLAQYVDTSTRPWRFRQVGEASMGNDAGSLIQFQRAQTIREVYFPSGSPALTLTLELKPIEMDATITQFLLDVDGKVVRYSHGPQVPVPVQWPGPRGSNQVRLQISPATAGNASGVVYEGPWALLRMLDQAQMERTSQAERYIVTFDIDGRRARFQLITTSVENPFRLQELQQFRCPGRL